MSGTNVWDAFDNFELPFSDTSFIGPMFPNGEEAMGTGIESESQLEGDPVPIDPAAVDAIMSVEQAPGSAPVRLDFSGLPLDTDLGRALSLQGINGLDVEIKAKGSAHLSVREVDGIPVLMAGESGESDIEVKLQDERIGVLHSIDVHALRSGSQGKLTLYREAGGMERVDVDGSEEYEGDEDMEKIKLDVRKGGMGMTGMVMEVEGWDEDENGEEGIGTGDDETGEESEDEGNTDEGTGTGDGEQEQGDQEANENLELTVGPDIHVVRIDGFNIDVRIRSPFDASKVQLEGGGVLGIIDLAHEGGTCGDMASVTFMVNRRDGLYNILLKDPQGNVLDSVPFQSSNGGRRLTVCNADDWWTVEDYAQQLAAKQFNMQSTGDLSEDVKREVQLEALHAQAQGMMEMELQNQRAIENMDVSYAQVREQRNSLLWEESRLFLPRNEAEQLFFEKYPQYREENIQETIDREWRADPTFRRGQVEDRIRSRIGDLLDRVYQGCNAYNADMQNLVLPAALEVLMGVRRGEVEFPLLESLDKVMCCLHGNVTIQLFIHTTFQEPDSGDVLNAAKHVLFECVDIVEHFDAEDRELAQKADRDYERYKHAQWVAALEESQRLEAVYNPENKVPREVALANQQQWIAHMEALRAGQRTVQVEDQSRSYARAQRLTAAAMQESTDHRIEVVVAAGEGENIQRVRQQESDALVIAMTESEAQGLDAALAGAVEANPDDPDAAAAASQRVLLARADEFWIDAEAEGVSVRGTERDRVSTIDEARLCIRNNSVAQNYAEAMTWYQVGIDPDPSKRPESPLAALEDIPLCTDSVVGRVFYGLVLQLHAADSSGDQLCCAAVVERVCGIPAEEIVDSINVSDAGLLARVFEKYGYGNIFESVNGSAPTQVLSAHARVEGETVRVFFDYIPDGREISSVKVYGKDIPVTPTTFSEGTRHTTFVDVPAWRLLKEGDKRESMKIDVVAAFTDGFQVGGETNRVTVRYDWEVAAEAEGLKYNPEDFIPAEQWLALDAQQKQELREALSFGDLSETPENEKIIRYLVENYLQNGAMSFDTEKMEWRGEAYVDDPSTDKDDLVGECKYWVQMDVILKATDRQLPNNDPQCLYAWRTDVPEANNVEVLGQSTGSGIEGFLQSGSVRTGDIIQYHPGGAHGHTVIIGKVDEDGVWVFDSNMGNDLTPRYHKISYANLNSNHGFTVYHVRE